MNVLVSFQKQDSDIWSIYSKNPTSSTSTNIVDFVGIKYFNQKEIHYNDEIRLIKIGKNIMIKKGYSDVSQLTSAEKAYVYK